MIVLVEEDPTEDEDWNRMAIEQFFKDDAEGDAIYDELSSR